MAECTTEALHCVACGKPSTQMQGSLSDCCDARVTRKTTCDGKHETWTVPTSPSSSDVDDVLVPYLADLVRVLVAAGRDPQQAGADLTRAAEQVKAQIALELTPDAPPPA